MEERIDHDNQEFVPSQLDGWCSYRHGYMGMGMLISYLTKNWKRGSLCLACSPFDDHNTGENIALDSKLTSWKALDKTTVVVSDDTSNMINSMEYLPNSMEHCGYLNHVLQLSINDEVFNKPEDKTIMSKVKAFINYHSMSVLLAAALEKVQKDLGWEKVLQPVKEWNTTHNSSKRFVELKYPITKVLDDAEWIHEIKVKEKVLKFSSHEWKVLENLVKVLEFFKEATLER